MATVLKALIRKDLQLFASDRRAVLMGFAVPIAIASFFGSIFSGASNTQAAKIPIAIVDLDRSAVSARVIDGARNDAAFTVTITDADAARDAVRKGTTTVAVIIPARFGDASGRAFFGQGEKPALDLLYDPSHAMELAMVRGVLTQYVMEAVSADVFGGAGGQTMIADTLKKLPDSSMPKEQQALLAQLLTSVQHFNAARATASPASADGVTGGVAPGLTMPYSVKATAVTSGTAVAYNGYAHAFAGMGIQFLLFAAANLGVEVLLERQRGLWKRLRAAPISRRTILVGKALSGAIIALAQLLVSFGFAMLVFGVRIHGSVIGFIAVAAAAAVMASTFGLLIAALGKTPSATRGVTTFAILIMVMLGGAWVPTFIFPAWLQKLTVVIPVRWAVDGLDAMTWRGLGIHSAIAPVAALVGFAALFWIVANNRFRWEE